MKEAALLVLCYLLGSIPFSYLFTRMLTRQDIRKRGSGNVGATNVFRTSGPGVALLAFLGDLLKGLLAAWIGQSTGSQFLLVICVVLAVIGHIYPVFLGFKGGKGVTTSAGIILFLMPDVTGILLLVFLAIVYFTRYVSLGSITVACLLPLLSLAMGKPWSYIVIGILMAALVVYHHRENIDRLRNGSEAKITDKAK